MTDAPPIAFATCADEADLDPDDRLAVDVLAARGVEVAAPVWDDPAVDWGGFGGVVIRSCWDYHLRLEAFRAWLDALDGAGVPVWNATGTVRWNLDKARYLGELASAGFDVVPTEVVPRGAEASLAEVIGRRDWRRAVLKPAVSLSAWRTHLVEDPAAHEGHLAEILADGDALVQEFQPAVRDEGEWSVTYLDGARSHTTLKRPRPGDFRSQTDFGGSRELVPPPAEVAAAADALAARTAMGELYARVDLVRAGGRALLMEVELIDPVLNLAVDPGAPARFADAILRRVEDRAPGRGPS